VRSGRCLKTLQGPGYSNANWIRSVAFSRDSTVLATGSDDQMVKLWSVSSGECLRIFSGHAGRVWSVDFSPHGSLLASGDDDGVVVVWEVKTGHCYRTFRIDRPYERMNIRGVVGITEAQKASLRALGAVENLQDLSS
jgi:WD40 repeat protein